MFSQGFIENVKACGVMGLVKQFTTVTKVSKVLYQAQCPHPDHNDSDPSFRIFIDPKTGMESWACMGCHQGKKDGKQNFGSDNIAFVRWMSSHKKSKRLMAFPEAIAEVAKFYGLPLETDSHEKEYAINKQVAIGCYYNMFDDVRQYLHNRGLNDFDISKWLIGYDGDRIVFPIMNRYCKILGFSNRYFSQKSIETKRKYINSWTSDIFDKKRVMYGIQFYNNLSDYIIIAEGQLDCILAHKYGVDTVVSTLCCHLTEFHIDFIKKMGKIPILCYDGDESGLIGINKALEDLYAAGIMGAKVLILPVGKDLADVANTYKEDLKQYIQENIMTHSQYVLDKLAKRVDSKMNSVLAEIFPDIQKALSTIKDPFELEVSRSYIKKRLHLWLKE